MRNFIFLAPLFPLPALAGGDAAEAYVTGVSMAVEASDTVLVYQDGREGLYPYLPNP